MTISGDMSQLVSEQVGNDRVKVRVLLSRLSNL